MSLGRAPDRQTAACSTGLRRRALCVLAVADDEPVGMDGTERMKRAMHLAIKARRSHQQDVTGARRNVVRIRSRAIRTNGEITVAVDHQNPDQIDIPGVVAMGRDAAGRRRVTLHDGFVERDWRAGRGGHCRHPAIDQIAELSCAVAEWFIPRRRAANLEILANRRRVASHHGAGRAKRQIARSVAQFLAASLAENRNGGGVMATYRLQGLSHVRR